MLFHEPQRVFRTLFFFTFVRSVIRPFVEIPFPTLQHIPVMFNRLKEGGIDLIVNFGKMFLTLAENMIVEKYGIRNRRRKHQRHTQQPDHQIINFALAFRTHTAVFPPPSSVNMICIIYCITKFAILQEITGIIFLNLQVTRKKTYFSLPFEGDISMKKSGERFLSRFQFSFYNFHSDQSNAAILSTVRR